MLHLPILVIALLAPLGSAAQTRPDIAEVNHQLIDAANAFRRSHGMPPTAANPRLTAAAQGFAEYMAASDRYAHDADGTQPSQRARAQGYDYCLVSENIAYAFHSDEFRTEDLARRFIEGWKQSPRHRHNMLDADASDTGVAVARSARSGRYYAVQMFGRPQSKRIEFRIANRSTTPVRYELGGEWYQLPPRMTRTHGQCRAETLTMRLPGDEQPVTIQPAAGELYAVERVGTRLRLGRS